MPAESSLIGFLGPTRAHNGIATFVHIVLKSPKPIFAVCDGRKGNVVASAGPNPGDG